MGFDYNKRKSTYKFQTHCICDGYFELIPEEMAMDATSTHPCLHPVKCKICNRKSHSSLKVEEEWPENV